MENYVERWKKMQESVKSVDESVDDLRTVDDGKFEREDEQKEEVTEIGQNSRSERQEEKKIKRR